MNEVLEIEALRKRVSQLEAKMYFLYKHFDVTFVPEEVPPEEADPKVVAQLKKGDLMGAIREYRGIHQVNLEEAKAAVDELKARLGL